MLNPTLTRSALCHLAETLDYHAAEWERRGYEQLAEALWAAHAVAIDTYYTDPNINPTEAET